VGARICVRKKMRDYAHSRDCLKERIRTEETAEEKEKEKERGRGRGTEGERGRDSERDTYEEKREPVNE